MERNGDVVTEFNYCPERFRLNINNFDLVDSKMCKDDISKSLFCDVPKSLRNDILPNELDLKNQCIDLVTSEKTYIDSNEHMLLPTWNSSDPYDFSSSKKMSLNKFISKDSFINGKRVLSASKSSFQIDNCFPPSKSAIASESSLDTTSDSPQEESSSSSIEEIFCPIANNPAEVKAKYIARVEAQNALQNIKTEPISDNPSLEKINPCIPKLISKEGGETGQKKDRVMPELIPTLICLDDEDEEDSIPNYEEKSPPIVNVVGSPEMPKLIPFSTEADELLRLKAENLDEKGVNKNTPPSVTINAQKGLPSLNNSEKVMCQSVDLKTCTRKLFPDAEVDQVESFKAKYSKYLSSPVKEHDNERGFSFSASFKSSKQQLQNLSRGIDLSVKKTKSWQDKSSSKNETFDDQSHPQKKILKDDKKNYKDNSSLQKSINDSVKKITNKKAHRLSIDEKVSDADNSISNIRQPKILLRRISLDQCSSLHGTGNLLPAEKITFEHCLPSHDSDDNNSLTSRPECDDNSSNEAPEIEEIEGIRFFQFRSKRDMEEFNRKPMVGEIDMEMIVPTKTTDITQIKGWRNKYFATDSQLHYLQSDDGNSRDESSQNAKSVPMLAGSTETKCLDFRNCLNDNKILGLKDTKFVASENEVSKSNVKETLKDEKPASAMSPFVSKDLDDFLLNSATLNISLLQKVNPNIIPIPPDASILGLGKLCQPNYELNTLAALKRRNFLNKLKEERKPPPIPAIYSSDSDDAVIVLSSSDESSTDDDVPVAKLHAGRKRMATPRSDNSSPASSVKRRKSDASLDGAQRVVLRLTKESRGTADGYKVSDISLEKENSEDSSSSSSSSSFSPPSSPSSSGSEKEELPDEFKKAANGSSPVIKDTIFLKESEPKLLEEFLNNLNVLGTNNDVAMLVQSNHSYFVKGPVLQSEMCSEALDALLTNKEFIDSKNKHTPKKKLKAWQKYLPKKLSKIQQQKIATLPHVSKVKADAEKKPPKLEVCEKSTNLKNEKVITSKGNIKLKKYNFMKKLSKTEKLEPKENIANIKLQPPVSNEVPKVRKRRSRSAIELSDPFSLVERGKRSIRLPARYLDSAVLAAGSEWVSPIFVEEEKKTRKQLLDVLEKITPAKEILTSEENKKDIPKKEEPSPSVQPVTKKISNDNNQLNKATKRQIKTSSASKKMKIDDVKDCITIKESSNSPKIQRSSIAKNPLEDFHYPMPSCSCSPCSRTLSYKKFTKEFLCFSHTHEPCVESNSKTILEKEAPQESTVKESAPTEIKLNSSVDPKSVKESEIQDNSLNAMSESSQSDNSIKESEIQSKVTEVPEGIQSNITLAVPNNPLTPPKVANTIKILTSKEISVAKDGSKKLVFLLPSNSAQKTVQLSTELKSTPPILSRKLSTESPDGAKTSSIPRIIPHPPVASSTPNSSPIVFKLPIPDNRNSRPLLPKLPQTNSLSQAQAPINSANAPGNLKIQPSFSQQADLAAKGYKIGGVYLYNPGNDKNSSPMIAYVTNKNSSGPLPSMPVISNNAAVQEEQNEVDNASSTTPPKVSLDLHNYNKKLSERRRKSPLSERVFKESPENVKVFGGLPDSDVDVDVDTVDEKFNPKIVLKKQLLLVESGSDASDIECDEIFSTNLNNLIYSGLRKSITERKRRLLIKKSFERLKVTSPFFTDAKNCVDILNMATFAVKKLKAKEMALKQAKRILRLHNAHLLEKLASQINDIKDAKSKQVLKKQIITTVANDWVKFRQRRAKVLSRTKKVRKDANSSPKVDPTEADPVPKIGIESQSRVVSQQLDFEIEESPEMHTSDPPIQFEGASKDLEEQPHVQLRILELPSNETEKDIISLMDTEVEVQMEKTPPIDDKVVNLPQQTPEKNLSVPAGTLDGNNSDDDLLIIDLEENETAKASPQKSEPASQGTKPVESPPPMREFPGLVPIFPPEFYQEDNPFAIDLSKFAAESKTLSEDRIDVDAIRNSLNASSERTPGNRSTDGSKPQGKQAESAIAKEQLARLGYKVNAFNKADASNKVDAYNKVDTSNKVDAFYKAGAFDKVDASPNAMLDLLKLSPRNPLHRTCKDVKILHGIGNGPDDEIQDEHTSNTSKSPAKIHEEIVIDDSDDEPMDLEQKPGSSTPSESSFQFRPPVTSVIDEIMIEEDSQIKNPLS